MFILKKIIIWVTYFQYICLGLVSFTFNSNYKTFQESKIIYWWFRVISTLSILHFTIILVLESYDLFTFNKNNFLLLCLKVITLWCYFFELFMFYGKICRNQKKLLVILNKICRNFPALREYEEANVVNRFVKKSVLTQILISMLSILLYCSSKTYLRHVHLALILYDTYSYFVISDLHYFMHQFISLFLYDMLNKQKSLNQISFSLSTSVQLIQKFNKIFEKPLLVSIGNSYLGIICYVSHLLYCRSRIIVLKIFSNYF